MSHLYIPITSRSHKHASPDSWEHIRPLITHLYSNEYKTLPEVMRILAQTHNHYGTIKQYKCRIKKWGLDKKHKETEMRAIVNRKRQRDAIGKDSAFSVRGRPVTAAEVFRYFRRKGVLDPEAEAGSVDVMPEAVRCWTPSPGEESQLLEMDANLKDLNEWPLESPNMDDFGTMGLVSTTGTNAQPSRIFTINQMRRLLSLSPEIQTLEISRSLLPPQTLLMPERLLFDVKAYFEGSFRNGTFFSDDQGKLNHVTEVVGAEYRLHDFFDFCVAAEKLIGGGAYLEGRRLLSKACVLVKDIIQDQHPLALECIIKAVLCMSRQKHPEIGTHLLSYVSEMATHLPHATYPWRQILFRIGSVQDSDLQPLLEKAWACTTDMFQNFLGPFHADALYCNIIYTIKQVEPKIASRLLLSLLERAEQEMDGLDKRIMRLRVHYGICLFKQERYAEVIQVVQEIHESSMTYTTALELLARCNFKMGHMHKAEMNMRECIKLWKVRHDRANPAIIGLMDTLRSWLRWWGRAEESESLEVEIRELTEWEGIDEI